MSERKAKHDLGSGFWKCPACQPTGPANRFDCRVCDATGMVSSEAYDAFEEMVDVMHSGGGEPIGSALVADLERSLDNGGDPSLTHVQWRMLVALAKAGLRST